MLNQASQPDWLDIQSQFREYIAAYHAGEPTPECRDRLFSSIYQAVEYLSIVRYRQYAGHGTKQTELALDGVRNLFWKVDQKKPSDTSSATPACPIPAAEVGAIRIGKNATKQRTFTSLLTEEYRQVAPLGNFLSTVVGNALRDWFREQNRNNKLNLQLDDAMFKEIFEIGVSEIPATSMHLEWGLGCHPRSPEAQIEANALREIVATLDERDRKLIDLYYFQEMSSAEISELTCTNQSTVRTQLSRAIQTMRDVLSNAGIDQDHLV
jgi:RNA polymerase sigma factor (sigma-70 family)